MSCRAIAINMLAHSDSIARLIAIESFKYYWYFDYQVAIRLVTIAIQDCEPSVRYTAASILMLMHLRSKDLEDKNTLLGMLTDIASQPSQISDIVTDLESYLNIFNC